MAIAQAPTTAAWLERARALAPIIAKYRDEGERDRQLPDATFEAMRNAGLYNLLLPRALGGHQSSIEAHLLTVEEVARHDGAAGWNLMIGMQGGLLADYLPEPAAQRIFGGAATLGAGSIAPTGKAILAPGGYRVSGRWSFASGCRHAHWMLGGALVHEDGNPRLGPDGTPLPPQLFFMPAAETKIIDTWHTGGLRGTGSHDFEAADVFVPDEQSFPFPALLSGPPPRDGTGHSQPFLLVAALAMGAVALGIARDAIDSFKTLAAEKTPTGGSSKLGQQSGAQAGVGNAEALVASARLYLYDAMAKLTAFDRPDDDVSALVRLASAHSVRSAIQATDLMYDLAGGSSVYTASRLDRCFRDVHTVNHHTAVSAAHIELVGQYLLGGPLLTRR